MESAAILEQLVAFPTVSSASNLDLIAYVETLFAGVGWRILRVPDATGRKASLFASLGPEGPGGILLSGHTDVVPVEGQPWTSDPFTLVRRDDRLQGRGAADMKGFIACALRAAALAAARPPGAPLHLALSYDEEVGCVGVRPMIERLAALGVRPELAIVGEPTGMRIATGHKGKLALRATCCGRAGHSALAPQGVNAIHLATDLVARLRDHQRAIASEGAREAGYEVPYTTVHVGKIAGGTALNIVPDRCVVDFEIRSVADPAALLDAIFADAAAIARSTAPDAAIGIETVGGYPGLSAGDQASAIALLAGLTADPSPPIRVDFGTEGGLYQAALGVPVLVCGPGFMEQGHKADEYVSLDQLRRCDAMMDRIVERLRS